MLCGTHWDLGQSLKDPVCCVCLLKTAYFQISVPLRGAVTVILTAPCPELKFLFPLLFPFFFFWLLLGLGFFIFRLPQAAWLWLSPWSHTVGTPLHRELCSLQEPPRPGSPTDAQRCITSYIKKAGRSPRVLLFAASELLSSAQISLFSFPKDGFSSFLQEQPCLAQGAAAAGSSYGCCWHQFAEQPPLKLNLQIINLNSGLG